MDQEPLKKENKKTNATIQQLLKKINELISLQSPLSSQVPSTANHNNNNNESPQKVNNFSQQSGKKPKKDISKQSTQDEDMEVTDFPALESSNRNRLETAQPELSIRPNHTKTKNQLLQNYLEQKDNEEYETTTNKVTRNARKIPPITIRYLTFFLFFLEFSLGIKNDGLVKSRRKRYVAFPEGSTFIATLCLTWNIVGRTENIFVEGLNWGISYDLPNATTVMQVFNTNKFAHKRRQRRDLYNRIESVLENMGFEGKPCIYRAMCESARKLNRNDLPLAQEILRKFFTYPLERLSNLEPDEHREYHSATKYSLENRHLDCSDLFSDCTFSIVNMALGNYLV
ncbi:unnamed protein product [Ceutorhynchus assimilis]|uniref:Uncharacterized protein n=1 Tax=Ceutorhynchus assimilis TaxID=467358 RepID=A0A9N9MXD3_9CUCU|nr:unnamed protein product [Ceutorhynchus assimilis]